MVVVGFAVGFVDFSCSLTVSEVAELLSKNIFGGIEFIEKDVEEEHDLGTLCLARDFLGLQVDLFGENGKYTVEIGTRPSASVPTIHEVCDLSAMLRHSIDSIADCVIKHS